MALGYFCIIQYCPDLDRDECANVGVVILAPSLGALDIRLDMTLAAPARRFGRGTYDESRLLAAMKALAGRIWRESRTWTNGADLLAFSQMEGNNVRLSAPRYIMTEDPNEDAVELFQKLVAIDSGGQPAERYDPTDSELRDGSTDIGSGEGDDTSNFKLVSLDGLELSDFLGINRELDSPPFKPAELADFEARGFVRSNRG